MCVETSHKESLESRRPSDMPSSMRLEPGIISEMAWHASARSNKHPTNPSAVKQASDKCTPLVIPCRWYARRCINPFACPGGNNNTCAEGYVSNLCGNCAPGRGKVDTFGCRPCWRPAVIISLYVLAALLMLAVAKVLCHLTLSGIQSGSTRSSGQRGRSPMRQVEFLKILMLYLQYMWVLSRLQGIHWPETVTIPLRGLSWLFAASTPQSVGIECILPQGSHIPMAVQVFALSFTTPLLILAALLVADRLVPFMIAACRRGESNPKAVLHSMIPAGMAVLFLFLTTLSRAIFGLFACVDIDQPREAPYEAAAVGSFWLNDLSQLCWHGYHRWLALGVGLPLLCLFCLALPGAMLGFIIKHRAHLFDAKFAQFSFMYQAFKPSASYWGVVVVLQSMGLVAMSSFALSLGSYYACLAYNAALIVMIALHVYMRPYANSVVGKTALHAMVCVFLTGYSSLSLLPTRVDNDQAKINKVYAAITGVFVLCLNLAFVCTVTWRLFQATDWQLVRQRVQDVRRWLDVQRTPVNPRSHIVMRPYRCHVCSLQQLGTSQ